MNNAIRRLRRFVGLLGPVIALAAWSGTGHANAPPNRYTVTNGGTATGTVYDTFTGLTWQQAVPTSTYTWSAAITYCSSNTAGLPGTGWRLPKLKELQTIVDYTIAAPGPTDRSRCLPQHTGKVVLDVFAVGGRLQRRVGRLLRPRQHRRQRRVQHLSGAVCALRTVDLPDLLTL